MLFALSFSSQTAKVSVLLRVVAKVIDLFIVIVLSAMITRPLGPLLGFVYSLIGDGIRFRTHQGQSIGKMVMGLQVTNIRTRKPATIRDSILRNSPVGVATFFSIIPLWGWLILVLIGLPLMVMEIYLMATVDTGHRLGDVMGDTEVKEVRKA